MPPSSTTTATTPKSPESVSVSIFWPRGTYRGHGVCYGWLKPAVCVAGVLDERGDLDITTLDSQKALSDALSHSPLWKAVQSSCEGNPIPLGLCEFSGVSTIPTSLKLWMLPPNIPDAENRTLSFSFVLYRPHAPESLRFYVMSRPDVSRSPSSIIYGMDDPYRKLSKYDFTRSKPRHIDEALNDTVLNQMNASSLVQKALEHPNISPKLLPTTASFLLALASYLASLSNLSLWLSNVAANVTNLPLFPIPTYGRLGDRSKYLLLKDISATVQQFDVRVEQMVFFLTQIATLQRQNTKDIANYSDRYTNFFNTAWLIMNDMTIGFAFGAFLSENNIYLAERANALVQDLLFELPQTALFWLDAWPAGLKLNTQLSHFYVTTLIGVIDTWKSIIPPLAPSLFTTLGFLSSIGGFTLLLSLISDLLSLFLTVHLRVGYELARVVYWAAGVKLGGGLLWGVFRGKRRNVLRNRTDTWSYDIDQLLFGTILFTLLAFLFPTALVYYVLFAALRLATLLFQACIETLLAFMHHFPLFALMLRVKDPWRLSGGVYFNLHVPNGPSGVECAYLSLENQPIPLSAIFFQYVELWKRLAKHYNPLRLLFQVLTGQHLASIPRYSIRYAPEAADTVPLSKQKTE
uniref:Gpi1-domain-containing protein n=1 Tax=Psilocybe cubensis TaxID=181762 RepID=A0A8H8CFS1_PSICU